MRVRRSSPVVGLDLSLSRPAACLIPADWRLGDWSALSFESWSYPALPAGERADAAYWSARYARLVKIAGRVRDFVLERSAHDVFVEDYAFSRSSSAVTKLAELGGVVRVELLCYGRTALPVAASQARRQLLGKLPPKDSKVLTQRALYGHGATFGNDDECDAFVVANFGLSELGLTAMSLA